MRTRLVTLAVLAVSLAATASASAATIERNGDVIAFTGAQGDKVDLTVRAGNSSIRSLTFANQSGATGFTVRQGCSGSVVFASCLITLQGVRATKLRFTTEEGADEIDASNTLTPFDASLPEEFATGDGADELRAGPLADVVRAGPGADRITGGPGDDELFGEDGGDTFFGSDGADRIDGGAGTDRLDLTDAPGGVAVSINGVADDGPLGAGANVDVDDVLGSPFRDLLTGGPGANTLNGAGGDDLIDVRDGADDIVDCGPGTDDRAIADAGDSVSGCEVVELPPPPGQGGAPDAGAPADSGGSGPAPDPRPLLITARLSFGWLGFRDGTQADELRVRGLPAGGAVRLLCAGKGCPFKRRVARRTGAGRANLLRFLKRRRLPAGVVVEVRMTAPGFVGKSVRFTMRAKGRQPRRASLCLPPGAKRPSRCAL
jgi:Ca2+-binding RTX toxin-like protein